MRRAALFLPTYKHKIQKLTHKKTSSSAYLEKALYLAYLFLTYYLFYYYYYDIIKKHSNLFIITTNNYKILYYLYLIHP